MACCFSGGHDLVEEMVASDFWPLSQMSGHRNGSMQSDNRWNTNDNRSR